MNQFGPGRHRLVLKALTKDGKAFYSFSAPFEFSTGG